MNNYEPCRPGKFESCPAWVEEFWRQGLDGLADEDIDGVFYFAIEENMPHYRLSKGDVLALREDENGFVYHQVYELAWAADELRRVLDNDPNAYQEKLHVFRELRHHRKTLHPIRFMHVAKRMLTELLVCAGSREPQYSQESKALAVEKLLKEFIDEGPR